MKPTSSSDYQRELREIGRKTKWGDMSLDEHDQAILDLNERALPEEESYDDFEYGSHGDGWNDCIAEFKSILSKPIKENSDV